MARRWPRDKALTNLQKQEEKAPPRRRGRPKVVSDEAQRAAILAAANDIFLEHGYDGTTMDAVAARCAISKRTLYRLFRSKTALFVAMISSHRRSMLDLPRDDDERPLAESLAAIFRVDIDSAADRERMAFLRLLIVDSERFPELLKLSRRHGAEDAHALLSKWLARQCARGRISIDDVNNATHILMDMIFGAIVAKPKGEFVWPRGRKRDAYIRQCIDIFLNGVRPR